MKKITSLIVGAALMLTAGSAWAVSYQSVTNFGFLGRTLSGTGTTTWTQAMPGDFQIPYDTINSATLTISAQC